MPENNFKLCLQGPSPRATHRAREAIGATGATLTHFSKVNSGWLAEAAAGSMPAATERAADWLTSEWLPFLVVAPSEVFNQLKNINKWGRNCA